MGDRNVKLSMAFTQLFCDKTATTLKSTALLHSCFHFILLNIFPRRRQWLIDKGLTLVEFLQVFCNEEQLK